MAQHSGTGHNGAAHNGAGAISDANGLRLKIGLAEMLKGGVIMDVTDARQAEIAERAGAVAVMALERVPAQIRAEGGVARMASPKEDTRDHGDGVDSGDGEMPHWSLCRSAGAAAAWR